ncbi:hypothetical protein F5887DRAFT_263521 [Amanita rubescens]|nr:hypothetical protein F5887DRAFT_263521 [Amanita rubescens]
MLYLAEREKRRKRARSLKSDRRREPILRPAGRSGRDWNLCERMGLIRRKRTYNEIRASVQHHVRMTLDTTMRISAQEDLAVCKVIRYVVKEFPELKIFHNGWPIRQLIRQYLSNRVSYEKKLQEEMAAEERRERGYSYGNERPRRLVNYAYYSPSERSAETSDEESSSDHDAAPTRKSNMTELYRVSQSERKVRQPRATREKGTRRTEEGTGRAKRQVKEEEGG